MKNFYNVDRFGDRLALVTEEGKKISYQELSENTNRLGKHLERNTLAFCICNNCEEAITGYLAFLRFNVAVVLLNDTINKDLLDHLLNQYKPTYIWAPFSVTEGKTIYQFERYTLIETNYVKDYTVHEDLALLLTTSGSTGSPKLVRQSYRNLESNAIAIAEYLEITDTEKPITNLPMSYTYGLSIINSHLLMGTTLVLTNSSILDKKFWELVKTMEVTTFGGVPYTYEMLKKLRFADMNLPSLTNLTQAGGHLAEELVKEFALVCKDKNIRFYVMYGQTEASPRMSYVPYEKAYEKASSIGIAIPDGEFWLEDENENRINDCDVVGELVYRGENVAWGYSEDCYDLAKDDENNGVLHTGDMAKMDADGYYYIVGRKKRFLKLFGNRVNLDEVETMLKSAGFDCACVGSDDNMIIYTTDDCGKITDFIKQQTNINHSGFKVLNIENIPRNESGKVLYTEL